MKINNKRKYNYVHSLAIALAILLGGTGLANAGYLIYGIDKDGGFRYIEQIKNVSVITNNAYTLETINGFKITNTHTTLERAQRANQALKDGASLDIQDCRTRKYERELSWEGVYEYKACAAGVSTPIVNTADLLQGEVKVIDIKKNPIKIPKEKELNVH